MCSAKNRAYKKGISRITHWNKALSLFFLMILMNCGSNKTTIDLGYGTYGPVKPLLMLEANSVVRTSNTTLEIKSSQQATYTVKEAITILDEEDADYSNLVVSYDQLRTLNTMKVNLYDGNGKLLRSASMKEAEDFSDYDGYSFFTDNRFKVIKMHHSQYPYTIEYEYEIDYKTTLNLPAWFPQSAEQWVEHSTFTVIDHNTGVRFYQKNFDTEPEVNRLPGITTYTWDANLMFPKKREPLGPHYRDILPHVLLAPGTFKIESYEGDATSWKTFGKWYYEMGKGTRNLPNAGKKEVDELISGLTNEEEIVATLYRHLQEENRYVSIQLGVGGWKPFPAEYVFSNNYGDCKALTNYMQAMLEYAGIKAEPVLIRASGVPELIEEFPSNQFNHVILKVTLSNGKVIWLECTSKYLPPNNLADGKSIKALLITENGGEIKETPEADFSTNKLQHHLNIKLRDDGSAHLDAEVVNSGVLLGRVLHQLSGTSEKDQLEWLERSIPVDNRKIEEFDISELNTDPDFVTYSFKANLGSYANVSNKRIFVPVNKMNKWTLFMPEDEEGRNQPIEFGFTFSESDSTYFEIPEDYKVEFMPVSSTKKSSFGEYEISFEPIDERTYLFKRSLFILEPTIPSEKYDELKTFLDDLRKADAQQMVLVKAETE